MRERVCKHQETFFDTGNGIFISSCGCSECPKHLSPIGKKACNGCPHRVRPDESDFIHWDSMFNDGSVPIQVPERHASQQSYIIDNICSKCEYYDAESMECGACKCMVPPIDEMVRYKHISCPMGRW